MFSNTARVLTRKTLRETGAIQIFAPFANELWMGIAVSVVFGAMVMLTINFFHFRRVPFTAGLTSRNFSVRQDARQGESEYEIQQGRAPNDGPHSCESERRTSPTAAATASLVFLQEVTTSMGKAFTKKVLAKRPVSDAEDLGLGRQGRRHCRGADLCRQH
ncbi:unnamed protein product [Amoebophrya sp. A25]|nr:unnamed protein product [Amoebophrya sp. A25]|eukprot:GSA25T00004314001.1